MLIVDYQIVSWFSSTNKLCIVGSFLSTYAATSELYPHYNLFVVTLQKACSPTTIGL